MLGWGVPGVWSCDCAVDSTLKTKSMDLIYLASPAHKLIPDVLWIVREYHVHKEVYHTQISIQKWVTCERSSWAMWNIKNQWWSGELMRLEPPGCRCEEHPGWWLEREEGLDLRIRKISSKRTGCMNDAENTSLSFLLFLLKDFASTKTYGIGA